MKWRQRLGALQSLMAGLLLLCGVFLPCSADAAARSSVAQPARGPATTTVVFNEFVASNQIGLRDQDSNASDWIELTPQDFSGLKVTEIMYNPRGGGDYEFIELKNIGASSLNLAGVRLANGVDFTFPTGATLAPSQFAVLVNNTTAFSSRYPAVPIAGEYTRDLGNDGDTIDILDPLSATILSVTYGDGYSNPPWPTAPDELGYSLAIVDPNGNPNLPANWRASTYPNGSPGADDPAPFQGAILINEVLANSDLPFEDAIELYNPTNTAVVIGGWFLSDDAATLNKFRIPTGTTIPAYGYRVFYEYQFNPTPGVPPSFALSSIGEQIFLASADLTGTLTRYTTSVRFHASAANTSMGRHPTSTGAEFPPLSRTSFGVNNPTTVQQFRTGAGAANAYPLVGLLAIHELMYNPAAGGHEFIELANITDTSIPLYDLANPSTTWRFSNGISFTFPANTVIAPRSLALVVAIDPVLFATTYGVPADVPVFGPYTGGLDNRGERLTLARPATPIASVVPWIPVDSIAYNDAAPWPTSPDGGGPSLERLSGPTFGSDPTLWAASVAGGTPGRANAACYFADVHPNSNHTQPALCDGDVDIADLQTVAACWNRALAASGCPPTLNVDGQGAYFSVLDIVAVATRWRWHR